MKKPLIITHSGGFQPDDICAVASLSILLNGDFDLIRTRDKALFPTGDYVVDVGEEHDPSRNRFDHHQLGGAGAHESGIPYAAFGLVWKTYGEKVSGSKEIAGRLEKMLVEAVDADDVGMVPTDKPKVPMYLFVDALYSFKPTLGHTYGFEPNKHRQRSIELTIHFIFGDRFFCFSPFTSQAHHAFGCSFPLLWHEHTSLQSSLAAWA